MQSYADLHKSKLLRVHDVRTSVRAAARPAEVSATAAQLDALLASSSSFLPVTNPSPVARGAGIPASALPHGSDARPLVQGPTLRAPAAAAAPLPAYAPAAPVSRTAERISAGAAYMRSGAPLARDVDPDFYAPPAPVVPRPAPAPQPTYASHSSSSIASGGFSAYGGAYDGAGAGVASYLSRAPSATASRSTAAPYADDWGSAAGPAPLPRLHAGGLSRQVSASSASGGSSGGGQSYMSSSGVYAQDYGAASLRRGFATTAASSSAIDGGALEGRQRIGGGAPETALLPSRTPSLSSYKAPAAAVAPPQPYASYSDPIPPSSSSAPAPAHSVPVRKPIIGAANIPRGVAGPGGAFISNNNAASSSVSSSSGSYGDPWAEPQRPPPRPAAPAPAPAPLSRATSYESTMSAASSQSNNSYGAPGATSSSSSSGGRVPASGVASSLRRAVTSAATGAGGVQQAAATGSTGIPIPSRVATRSNSASSRGEGREAARAPPPAPTASSSSSRLLGSSSAAAAAAAATSNSGIVSRATSGGAARPSSATRARVAAADAPAPTAAATAPRGLAPSAGSRASTVLATSAARAAAIAASSSAASSAVGGAAPSRGIAFSSSSSAAAPASKRVDVDSDGDSDDVDAALFPATRARLAAASSSSSASAAPVYRAATYPTTTSAAAAPAPAAATRAAPVATSSSSSALTSSTSLWGSSRYASTPRGLVGLSNLGNTCFMNSTLQCLAAVPPLTHYFLSRAFLSDLSARSPSKGAVAQEYGELIARMWGAPSRPGAAERPAGIKRVVETLAPRFIGYDQHDSQELLRFLVDALHDDVNRAPKLPYKELDESPAQSDAEVSADWWGYYSDRNDSVLKRLFAGQIKTQVQCCVCGFVSRAFDPFWDLALPIPKAAGGAGACGLSDCLREFTAEETLSGDDGHYCRRCKTHRASKKRMTLFKLPDVLVLHLKRFTFSSFRRTKLGVGVDFPETGLDMGPYLEASGGGGGDSALYDLVAVSNHSGSLNGGHYTADVRNFDDGEWYDMNDSRVSPSRRRSSSAAYLLFYVRQDALRECKLGK